MKEFKDDILNADSAAQALKKCTAKCGYVGNRRTMQRARQELKGRTSDEYYKQYRELEDYLKAMALYNPGSQYKLSYIRDNKRRRRFKSVVFAHGGLCKIAKNGNLRVFSMDTCFISSRKVVQQLYIFTGEKMFFFYCPFLARASFRHHHYLTFCVRSQGGGPSLYSYCVGCCGQGRFARIS